MPEIHELLENANLVYGRKGHNIQRSTEPEDPLDYSGTLESGRLVGLLVVATSQPTNALNIVYWDDDEKAPPKDLISHEAMQMLGSILYFRQGLAGILWLNAGYPAILGGPALANACRAFEKSMDLEDEGKDYPPRSRELYWSDFTAQEVQLVDPSEDSPQRSPLQAIDWLEAIQGHGSVTQDPSGKAEDKPHAPEPEAEPEAQEADTTSPSASQAAHPEAGSEPASG